MVWIMKFCRIVSLAQWETAYRKYCTILWIIVFQIFISWKKIKSVLFQNDKFQTLMSSWIERILNFIFLLHSPSLIHDSRWHGLIRNGLKLIKFKCDLWFENFGGPLPSWANTLFSRLKFLKQSGVQPSERLTSLGVTGAKWRPPWKSMEYHGDIIPRGLMGPP